MITRQPRSTNIFFLTRFVGLMRTPLYRNAYALILSAGTTSGLGIAYWVLAAHYYPISAVGTNAAAISSMMFLSGVAQLNLMGAMIRFIPAAGRATRRLIGSAYLISSLLAITVGIIFILGLDIWSPKLGFLRADLLSIVWFVLATVAWGIFVLQDNVLTGLRQATWVPVENSVFGIVKIALLILFAKPFPQYGIFASWTICVVATIVPINLLIFKRLLPVHIRLTGTRATPLVPAQIVRFVAGDYVGSLFWLASTTLLPLLVTQLAGARANAYFYLAWIIAYSLHLVSMNITISLTVEASTDGRALETLASRVLVHMAQLLTPMVAIVLLGAPYILGVFGHSYAAATALLRLLTLAALPYMVNILYISIARVRRQMRGIAITQGLLCILTLALSFIFIHMWGITGVGLAWLVSQTIVAVGLTFTHLRPVVRPVIARLSAGPAPRQARL